MKHPLKEILWMSPHELKPNKYNPNHVAKPEMELLRESLRRCGWLQPIVADEDLNIIDGYHRWTLSQEDWALENLGLEVPVVVADISPEQVVMTTIRLNRARGTHSLGRMSEITEGLLEVLTEDEVMQGMGMEREELSRLSDGRDMRAHAGEEWSKSWLPIFEVDDEV